MRLDAISISIRSTRCHSCVDSTETSGQRVREKKEKHILSYQKKNSNNARFIKRQNISIL